MSKASDTAVEYKRWLGRLRRALKREGEAMPKNKGWVMAQFSADRTPEEVARIRANQERTTS